jgi:hypothetical protein
VGTFLSMRSKSLFFITFDKIPRSQGHELKLTSASDKIIAFHEFTLGMALCRDQKTPLDMVFPTRVSPRARLRVPTEVLVADHRPCSSVANFRFSSRAVQLAVSPIPTYPLSPILTPCVSPPRNPQLYIWCKCKPASWPSPDPFEDRRVRFHASVTNLSLPTIDELKAYEYSATTVPTFGKAHDVLAGCVDSDDESGIHYTRAEHQRRARSPPAATKVSVTARSPALGGAAPT